MLVVGLRLVGAFSSTGVGDVVGSSDVLNGLDSPADQRRGFTPIQESQLQNKLNQLLPFIMFIPRHGAGKGTKILGERIKRWKWLNQSRFKTMRQ